MGRLVESHPHPELGGSELVGPLHGEEVGSDERDDVTLGVAGKDELVLAEDPAGEEPEQEPGLAADDSRGEVRPTPRRSVRASSSGARRRLMETTFRSAHSRRSTTTTSGLPPDAARFPLRRGPMPERRSRGGRRRGGRRGRTRRAGCCPRRSRPPGRRTARDRRAHSTTRYLVRTTFVKYRTAVAKRTIVARARRVGMRNRVVHGSATSAAAGGVSTAG